MNFNDLLQKANLDPERTLVFRHRPFEPALNSVLPWLAADRPELFNAYQQAQSEKVERAMIGAKHVAAFIGREAGKALFVGLYSIGKTKSISRRQFWDIPANKQLKALGMRGFSTDDPRKKLLWFDLALTNFYADWKGKLVVKWPPPERSWWRRAHRNEIPVIAVLDESALDAAMPPWSDIVLTWEELSMIPSGWRAKLSEWRAIYFIRDTSDGKGYVGSAYGNTNLLGRWQNYAAKGDGGNRLLRHRDPKNFRFSILQRVSPDMEAPDVINLENSWKLRLHSRHPAGLNDK